MNVVSAFLRFMMQAAVDGANSAHLFFLQTQSG
jgi:hypothetical protein